MKQATDRSERLPVVTRAGKVLFSLVEHLSSIVMTLESWRKHRADSMQFAHVDPRTLRDAGISEAQRFIEVNNPK